MSTALIYDPAFHDHDTGVHPENAARLDSIVRSLRGDSVLWRRLNHLRPKPASETDISRCHAESLFEEIRRRCERGDSQLDPDTKISARSFEVARLAAGAAIQAVDFVMEAEGRTCFSVVRPPGHHATVQRAMGFCLFNNAAIAARYAQHRYGVESVLIIDWDVHHGNGTQEIFYSDPTVFYFSTHQYPYYPGTGSADQTGSGKGEGFTLNVPLRARTPAAVHREAFSLALERIEKKFHPDLTVVSAGFDSRIGDPLGGLSLSDADFAEMTKEVLGLAERHSSGRVMALLEGGYNLDTLGETVRRHVSVLPTG